MASSYWTWKKFRGSWVQCSPPFYFISKSLSVLSFHFVFVCEFTHVVVYMFLCKGRCTHRSYRTLDVSLYFTYLLRQVPPSAVRHCICQADFPINFGVSPASSCHPATAALGLQISVILPDITWVLGIWTRVLTLYPLRHFPSPTWRISMWFHWTIRFQVARILFYTLTYGRDSTF